MTNEKRPGREQVATLTPGDMKHAERNERNLKFAYNLHQKVFADLDDWPENMVVLEIEKEILDRLFTPDRLAIVRTLRLDGPCFSGEELGMRLGRDPEEMMLDLLDLEMVGLIDIQDIGRGTRIRAPDCPIIIV